MSDEVVDVLNGLFNLAVGVWMFAAIFGQDVPLIVFFGAGMLMGRGVGKFLRGVRS